MTKSTSASTVASSALDEAFERIAAAGFELPNGFVNHGPMACEALAELGFDEEIETWARRFSRAAGAGVEAVVPKDLEWREALGDYKRLPEWIGFFEVEIEGEGWAQVVERWLPRLLPGLATALFHGVIRVAHATRAIANTETAPRREELARALGYWAARFAPGQPSDASRVSDVEDVHREILQAAANAARFYVASPSIFHLHGVTGTMAVELLAGHVSDATAATGLAHVRAEHVALYSGMEAPADLDLTGVSEKDLADDAASSGDPHQVKLVEACRRGSRLSGDQAFAVAAEIVTGRSV